MVMIAQVYPQNTLRREHFLFGAAINARRGFAGNGAENAR
jgi:hypothetical protein